MRFSLLTGLAGLSAFLTPALALSVQNGNAPEVLVDDDHKIPGQSPLSLCPGAHDKDLVTIKSVDLVPNPPKPYVPQYSCDSTVS